MKKLFFQAALAGTVLLGGVLAYTIWKAKPLSPQAYFESGKKYYDQKKYPEAIIQFLNAVRKDPRNRDARYFLALSYEARQDLSQAASQLRSLLEQYPDDIQANLQFGNLLLSVGRTDPQYFKEARKTAEKVLAKDPKNVAALILSGNAAAGLQDYSSSVDLFEQALTLDPQNLAGFVSLGTAQAVQKNYAEAETAFLRAREIDPKDKNAIISLANYYRATKDSKKAEDTFKEGLVLYPADRSIYTQAVAFYSEANRYDEVEQVLKTAQAKSTDDPSASLMLVDFYAGKDQPANARKVLLETKEKFPKDLDVAAKVALNFLQDHPERAQIEVDQIVKAAPGNPIGYVLRGEVQFALGQYDASEDTLGKAPAVDSPFPQVHFFLGNLAARKGKIDQAVFHFQKSLAVSSVYIPARVALAEILAGQGKLQESREELQKALQVRSDYMPARLLKAGLDNGDKKYAETEQELNSLVKDHPESFRVYRQMAIYDESRGRNMDAEKNYVKALELQPDSEEVLRDLTLFYVRQKQPERAIQRLNAIPDGKKDALDYELLGVAYSQAGKSQDAESAYKTALAKDPKRTSSEIALFNEYMRKGRSEDGIKVLDQLAKNNPSNANEAYAVKGYLLEQQGKTDEAKQNYGQALKAEKADLSYVGAANNLAYMMAEEGRDLNTALGYAQTARKNQPENEQIADTLGWVYYKMGSYTLAREQLKFAVSKEPDNAVFQYHLGLIYKQTKQIPEAESALKKAANSPRDVKEKALAQGVLKEIANSK
jgi:tetratricopeptide (TPR) repeat protein